MAGELALGAAPAAAGAAREEALRRGDLSAAHGAALLAALAELHDAEELVDCVLAPGPGNGTEMVPLRTAVGAAYAAYGRTVLRRGTGHRGALRGEGGARGRAGQGAGGGGARAGGLHVQRRAAAGRLRAGAAA